MTSSGFIFEVSNGDIIIRFSCDNLNVRISDTIENLGLSQGENDSALKALYFSAQDNVRFRFDGTELDGNTSGAYFFENTDYPVIVKGESEVVSLLALYISGHACKALTTYENRLYGTINFKNQVGRTDFTIYYLLHGKRRTMSFTTEVLSYKMNYREDMTCVIKDIEAEYSMLSYSFLKQTYLSFKAKSGHSSDLIWWQIFQGCYEEIVKATRYIINSPKLRLQTKTIFERADKLTYVNPEVEREYGEFKGNPNYLYRSDEMFLSKDTIENRFLKHVLQEVHRRFHVVRMHIMNSMDIHDDALIGYELQTMSDVLASLLKHPFFKSIGRFRGFSQDSLVMKRARGYNTIYKNWVLLECGYELAEGVHKLEVKDISELYEIWCFIKVKNIVQDILKIKPTNTGKELTTSFVRTLVYGEQSEVKFMQGDYELASVMYNAQTQIKNNKETEPESAIKGTKSFTTEQRPDIVLRLSRVNDSVKYTYLFDAKYRIEPKDDVPPADTLNQMHRYRDAIYYAGTQENSNEEIKKEVIGGYVLYPGSLDKKQYEASVIYKSIDQVNIGAFPLRPGHGRVKEDGSIDLMSSEEVLYNRIKHWLKDEYPNLTLLETSIPQHGLQYKSTSEYMDDVVLLGYVKSPSVYLPWIKQGHYVIRLNENGIHIKGGISPNRKAMMVQHVILYSKGEDGFTLEGIFDIKDPESIPQRISSDELSRNGYPSKNTGRSYLLYTIDTETPSRIAPYESLIKEYLLYIKENGGKPVFKRVDEILDV